MAAHRFPSMFTPKQHTKVFTCITEREPHQASAALLPHHHYQQAVCRCNTAYHGEPQAATRYLNRIAQSVLTAEQLALLHGLATTSL